MPRNTDIYNMCGIAGIISVNRQLVTTDRLTKMTGAIMHRGPDGEKHWINQENTTGFGHRRLSIIDLSANAAQPMHYHNRYTIVHNGEIYNYIELRQQLLNKGYDFTTGSDTEVILAAYDCWKEHCLQYFDGMFAFALWDEKEQNLFAARDRLGEKPFYYWFNGQELLFASEMKALWAAGAPKKVNEQLLFNFITLGYTQNPGNAGETSFNDICKLPAGSFFHHKPGADNNIRPVIYWQLSPGQTVNNISEKEAVEQFTALFSESVKNRLRSDVPLGTSLSGGLDSSSIAVLIRRQQTPGSRLQTFSAVFPGFKSDESRYIALLAAEKDIDNFTTHPTVTDLIDDFEKVCYHHEEFIGSASVFAQFRVFQLAKQHNIKVLLDGQGADEILAGYHKYYHWYWQELYTVNRKLLQQEITEARQWGVQDNWTWRNKISSIFPAYAAAYTKNARIRKQRNAAGLNKDFVAAFGTSYYQLPKPDSLQNVLRYNTCSNGLEELLRYADRNSMAHGREVRLPFLHHQLVEFIFSLPSHFKIKNGHTKWLLRKAMGQTLPDLITWRTDKIGFEPPQRQWMQHNTMQEYILESKKKLVAAGILQPAVISQQLQPLDAHAADNYDWRYLAAATLL